VVASAAAYAPRAARPDRRPTWIAKDINKSPRLLFLTDAGNNAVYIFGLPSLKPKGAITGLLRPQGACSDAAGNVWVVQSSGSVATQYSHVGALLQTLPIPGNSVACAVDKSTGNLAVTNNNGSVAVYADAQGTPTIETCSMISRAFFDDYIDGTLYVDGLDSSGSFALCSGTNTLAPDTLTAQPVFPGMVKGLGNKRLVLGDQDCGAGGAMQTCVKSYRLNGTTLTYENTTNLTDPLGNPVCSMPGGALNRGNQIFGGNGTFCADDGSQASGVGRWDFPSGGAPTNYSNNGLSEPIDAAISSKNG
jgi:hypothetical protein